MIVFVTVGSHPTFRFDRLLRALSPICADHLVTVQHGPAEPPDGAHEASPWLSFDEVQELMRRAHVVVSHAGAGTLLAAHQLGHTPVVAPRLARYGETVDDHQVELAKAFERTGRTLVAWQMERLRELIETAPRRERAGRFADRRLAQAVRAALLDR